MKKIIFISLLVFVNCLSLAQQNSFNKDIELQRFVERGGKFEEIEQNIFKLTYPGGMSRVYNFNRSEGLNKNFENVDTTIINIWEIDTTKYAGKFSFWQKVQVANSHWKPLPIEDLNNNNQPELYGYTDVPNVPFPPGGPVRIFERDIDGIYSSVFEYDSSTIFVKAMGDIHGTGGKDIYMHSKLVNNGVVYRSDSVGVLPTTFDFIFYYEPNQINDMTFGDFDNNGMTDCAFIEGAGGQMCFIGEYRKDINNFETVFEFSTTNQSEFSGFAINDFDQDGKTELVFGTGHGTVFVIENLDTNSYALIWQSPFPTYNAYMKTATSDIDSNGKPEFWIGGQDFVQGISRFQCYEADGDNNYTVVAVIELRYLVSLNTNYLQAFDIDDDSTEELIISMGNSILILKFVGSTDEHRYKVFYAKFNEATQPSAEFYPVAIADLDGDAKKDILLPFRKYEYPVTFAFSYILKQNEPSYLNEGEQGIINSSELLQNFPNPFNPTTVFQYAISSMQFISLKVYDVLGNEIITLVNEVKSAGNYELEFNSEGLTSGIYFYTLTAGSFRETKKMILLK